MTNWSLDEFVAVERMREVERQANRAYMRRPSHGEDRIGWQRLRALLGQVLVGLGNRLQRVEPVRRPDLASSSRCGLR